jgi:hypothetical protein
MVVERVWWKECGGSGVEMLKVVRIDIGGMGWWRGGICCPSTQTPKTLSRQYEKAFRAISFWLTHGHEHKLGHEHLTASVPIFFFFFLSHSKRSRKSTNSFIQRKQQIQIRQLIKHNAGGERDSSSGSRRRSQMGHGQIVMLLEMGEVGAD